MPIMVGEQLPLPTTRFQAQRQGYQVYYGHPRRQATRCGHTIHPSASEHTPSCPTCITSRAKTNVDASLREFIAAGGPAASPHVHGQRWQHAKLRYDIAKQRQATTRSRDQLREEREQSWDEAHQRCNLQSLQGTATTQSPVNCPICASMTSIYPTSIAMVQVARDTAWWEAPGGLVTDHVLVPRTPLRFVRSARQRTSKAKSPSILRGMTQSFRRAMNASEAHKQIWESRYRNETAVRRKYFLDDDYRFEANFWNSPISAYLSLQYHKQLKEHKRMVARRARGNTPLPRPPRSSLSYSQRADDLDVDISHLEYIWKTEEREMLERQARKIGAEVGYLYFVGQVDGLCEWSEDYMRSNRQLVYRKEPPEAGSEEAMSTSDSTESCDSDDSGEKKDRRVEDDEKMDIDI